MSKAPASILRSFLCVLCVSAVSSLPLAQADEINSLVRKARGFSDVGRYDQALPAWQEVVAKLEARETAMRAGAPSSPPSPHFIDALIEAGISASLVGRYGLAHQYLDRAVALGPRDPRALLNLGLVCLRERSFPRAEELFHRTLAVDPRTVDANLHLGIIAEERGDRALAKEYYIKEVNILGGTNRAWGRLFSLQSGEGASERSKKGGLSTTTAVVFFAVCLFVGGALLAVHRMWRLRRHVGSEPS